jgi:hypothetical protein
MQKGQKLFQGRAHALWKMVVINGLKHNEKVPFQ